ncbi:hypothetical protein I5Q34_34095 [Streptomyces sp. AV19]|uniref:hypothetical protein n=1 Tax=Streptomyces sp. AV19 TaxID=2793068 RepID=UPI0018FEEEB6|nr:hypothetical protein [Streptomyces sp. AV19]MBH1939233.1 hypothetical protein [Streptomyces sp. AV19]MDG4537185.1 hypothetical protein [Streptomyces sp. AV19]
MTTPTDPCPRCGHPLGDHPARSRMTRARTVAICTPCGQHEADRQARGLAPIPPGEWPLRRAA